MSSPSNTEPDIFTILTDWLVQNDHKRINSVNPSRHHFITRDQEYFYLDFTIEGQTVKVSDILMKEEGIINIGDPSFFDKLAKFIGHLESLREGA